MSSASSSIASAGALNLDGPASDDIFRSYKVGSEVENIQRKRIKLIRKKESILSVTNGFTPFPRDALGPVCIDKRKPGWANELVRHDHAIVMS